jgi:catechol 2,3-dioxygenase-like lactoylglutathione lyase family enzyme
MTDDIRHIHHVGLVVRDMEHAIGLYRKLGFDVPPAAYPMISPGEDQPLRPVGAGNTHVAFLRDFVELATVVPKNASLPEDAVRVPLQVPPEALPGVLDALERTIGTLAEGLSRFEGLHNLVFETDDLTDTLARFERVGVRHSGAQTVQRPVETTEGPKVQTIHLLEIDQEPVPEGRLAVAENPSADLLRVQTHMDHPNGAIDLAGSILCVPDDEVDAYDQRYRRYTGREPREDGRLRVFDLDKSSVTIVPAGGLEGLLRGETPPALPAFVAYEVVVRDLAKASRLLVGNGFSLIEYARGIFVPAEEALGAAVMFGEAS